MLRCWDWPSVMLWERVLSLSHSSRKGMPSYMKASRISNTPSTRGTSMPGQARWAYGLMTAAWPYVWLIPLSITSIDLSQNISDTCSCCGSSMGSTMEAESTPSGWGETSRYRWRSLCTKETIIAKRAIGSTMAMGHSCASHPSPSSSGRSTRMP